MKVTDFPIKAYKNCFARIDLEGRIYVIDAESASPADIESASCISFAFNSFILHHYFHFVEMLMGATQLREAYFPGARIDKIFFGWQHWNNQWQNHVQEHLLRHSLAPASIVTAETHNANAFCQVLLIFDIFDGAKRLFNKYLEPFEPLALGFGRSLYLDVTHSLQLPGQLAPSSRNRVIYAHRSPPRTLTEELKVKLFEEVRQAGFKIDEVDYSKMSFAEQVKETGQAALMISVHGNGLTNSLWLPDVASVIEIFPPDVHHYDYQVLAEFSRLHYFGIEAKASGGFVFEAGSRVGEAYGAVNDSPIVELPWEVVTTILGAIAARLQDGSERDLVRQDVKRPKHRSVSEVCATSQLATFGQLRSLALFHPGIGDQEAVSAIAASLEPYIRLINPRLHLEVVLFEGYALDDLATIETIKITVDNNALRLNISPSLVKSGLGSVVLARILSPLTAIVFATRDFRYPSLRLIVELGDVAKRAGLGFSSATPRTLLIPDSEFFTSEGYKDYRKLSQDLDRAWQGRRQKIFWRGSTTGIPGLSREKYRDQDDYRLLPRLELCDRLSAERYSDLCDVKISNIVQIYSPTMIEKIRNSSLMGERIERAEFASAKFLIDIDGNSNAWSGLFCNLLTGACVIKIASEGQYRQWYYDRLIPWENYVPVAGDMHDLDDAIEWVSSNDGAARKIGLAGQALVRSITFDSAMNDTITMISTLMERSSF